MQGSQNITQLTINFCTIEKLRHRCFVSPNQDLIKGSLSKSGKFSNLLI